LRVVLEAGGPRWTSRQPIDIPGRMLDTRDAAAFLGLSASTLNKMRVTGRGNLPFLKLGPRRVVYHPDDLRRWLDANRRRSTSDTGERGR
jgi:predicted DNA-binding transcriptional regulator AlpA